MTGPARHLVVFARAPRLGCVKRRLAADIGPVSAWAFYRSALAGVLRRLGPDARWQGWLAVTPDAAASDKRWPSEWRMMAQGSGDLGARMARAMVALPPGPAVVIGTDIPGITARHVGHAFACLGDHDAVFGPATDGGYWLVGLRRRPRWRNPFSGVRWSTAHALADTMANLRGSRVAMLETLEDVDDGASHDRWQRQGRAIRSAVSGPADSAPCSARP